MLLIHLKFKNPIHTQGVCYILMTLPVNDLLLKVAFWTFLSISKYELTWAAGQDIGTRQEGLGCRTVMSVD